MTKMELTFTGLCNLTIPAAERTTTASKPSKALLVDTSQGDDNDPHMPRHYPLLSFRARDYASGPLKDVGLPPGVPVTIAPDGEEIIHLPLDGTTVEIVAEGASEIQETRMEWALPSRDTPDPGEEGAMDWVPNLTRLGLAAPDLNNASSPPKGVTSIIDLPHGRFEARRLVMNELNQHKPEIWSFKNQGRQAIADHVVLITERPADRVVRVKITPWAEPDKGETHRLVQPRGDEILPLSITNLPKLALLRRPAEEGHGQPTATAEEEARSLHHLRWYGELSPRSSDVILPTSRGATRTRQGTICPSTRTHT